MERMQRLEKELEIYKHKQNEEDITGRKKDLDDTFRAAENSFSKRKKPKSES